MIATTEMNVTQNFDKICDTIIQNCEPIIVTRSNNENIVLISQSEYNNLLENIYIRKDPANYKRILESIEQAKSGKLTELNIGDEND